MDEKIVSAFAAVLSGPGAVATDSTTLAEKSKDYWGFGAKPGLVLRPRTRDEVVAIVKIAATQRISLVTRGEPRTAAQG